MIEIAKKAERRLKFKFPYGIHEWLTEKNMVMENYHKHTTWSDLIQIDSATSINDFMKKSDDNGCKCYFSGEHGYPGEWLFCYDVCKQTEAEDFRKKIGIENPLKFRYSAEVYWVKDINYEKTESYIDKKRKKQTRTVKDNANCHMVLVARNYTAIRKLNYIISLAHDQGFYYKPRIDLNMLFELNPEDIYITSACVAGWKYSDAEEVWLKIWKHFGDSFFLEYQTNNTPEQKKLNEKIYQMSQKYGIQTIIGLDTHYIDDEDRIKRDDLLVRKGINYPEEDGWYMDFPNGTEVFKRMKDQDVLPDEEIIYAMMNTNVFINGCEDLAYDKDFKIPILPNLKNENYETRSQKLLELLKSKFEQEDDEHRTQDRYDGMLYEYGEIDGSGTVDYFLSNNKLVDLAVNKYGGQLTTTSRGSASSYYTSKLFGFTTVDRFESEVPIYPERFITKDRVLSSHQCPDIDLNISEQEPFVQAARELFGEHGCYPLLAVGKLGEKSGFKLYAGVKGIEPSIANDITTCIDKYNEAVKQADDEDKDSIHIEDYIIDEKYLKIFNDSKEYQGIIEQAKVHACGFLIFNGNHKNEDVVGYGDIRYEIGLIRCHSESTGKSTVVANIEGGLLDAYGYVKDDFLIVDVVSIIYKLYHSIGREVPTVSELRKMVTDDKETWKLYEIGATCCLNQCEKPATTKRVMKYKPQNIKELSAFIAGIRPGFKSLIDGFLNRVPYSNGEKAIDDLLEDCFHYMLYQEAVMKIFSYLGIPMKDSYDTIKKISKKKLKGAELEKVENNLKSHWLENIGNLDNFEPVYQVIKDSARYSFNAPHAGSMCYDSLYEAWFKAHHTSKFYEVTLNHYQEKNDKDKIADLIKEATKIFGYEMGSYEYGKDNSQFTIDDSNKIIYPSLASIKGIGQKAVADLYKIAQSGTDDFIDIYTSINGTKINSSVFSNLVKIGYFKKYGTIKNLLEIIDIVDAWKGQKWEGRKTISKEEVKGFNNLNIKLYATDVLESGKISEKQYKIFDWKGLVRELASQIDEEEYSLSELLKYQLEILGYIEYVNPELTNKHIAITELDTTYSPKFKAYCLKNGQICEMKIHKKRNPRDKTVKTSFVDIPFENGDILYMDLCTKKPKQRKNENGDWEVVPGEFNWWIDGYSKVNL